MMLVVAVELRVHHCFIASLACGEFDTFRWAAKVAVMAAAIRVAAELPSTKDMLGLRTLVAPHVLLEPLMPIMVGIMMQVRLSTMVRFVETVELSNQPLHRHRPSRQRHHQCPLRLLAQQPEILLQHYANAQRFSLLRPSSRSADARIPWRDNQSDFLGNIYRGGFRKKLLDPPFGILITA